MQCLLTGTFPTCRHDGTPWEAADSWRAKQQGRPLGLHALHAEVRGGWKAFKDIFRFPGWQDGTGICWMCDCGLQQLREASFESSWRDPEHRLSHWQFLAKQHQLGRTTSTLFSTPFLQTKCFLVDWLHCCDKGVASDFIANLLWWMVLPKMEGDNTKERCDSLWDLLQEYYKRHKEVNKYSHLVPTMIQSSANDPPKMRGSAAEIRALVPWALELAEIHCSDHDPQEKAAKTAARLLSTCYDQLSPAVFCAANFQQAATRFVNLIIFLERTCAKTCPSLHWCYRDEDFGGAIALIGRRRGGINNPGVTSQNVLTKFVVKHSLPHL